MTKLINLVPLLLFSCNAIFPKDEMPAAQIFDLTPSFQDDFEGEEINFDDWYDDSSRRSPANYYLENGSLKIGTRAQTSDRVKLRTFKDSFGLGKYEWRIFVPAINPGDQVSVGAFLYFDDEHEFDFEIGYGQIEDREMYLPKTDELLAFCVSQSGTSKGIPVLANAWHTFSLELTLNDENNFLVKWLINEEVVKELNTDFGEEITFSAICSVENLSFMGEQLPVSDTYALFDYFRFYTLLKE